jgi:hypothetical protein
MCMLNGAVQSAWLYSCSLHAWAALWQRSVCTVGMHAQHRGWRVGLL